MSKRTSLAMQAMAVWLVDTQPYKKAGASLEMPIEDFCAGIRDARVTLNAIAANADLRAQVERVIDRARIDHLDNREQTKSLLERHQ